MDDQPTEPNRRSVRKPVLLSAIVEVAGERVPVRLRNLSEEGALIEGARLPPAGTTTWFERGALRLIGKIVWADGNFAGILFARRLDAAEVLRYIATPKAQPDPVHWRPGLTNHNLTPAERRMVEEWNEVPPAPRQRG